MYKNISHSTASIWTKLFSHDRQSEAIRLIYSYRYASLFITSIFYLSAGPIAILPYKLATVVSLYIAARLITDIYVRYLQFTRRLQTIILLETLIITLLLAPTGGLDSPFIWYALNPVLVAAAYLSSHFCWFNLVFYMTSAAFISSGMFNKGNFLELLMQRSYLMLVFILITLLVQLMSALLKKLNEANKKQSEALEHTMSLYKIIEAFTSKDELQTFFQTFTNYLAELTKAKISFFWQNTDTEDLGQLFTNDNISKDLQVRLQMQLELKIANLKRKDYHIVFKINNRSFQAVVVKSSTKIYGVLGIEVENYNTDSQTFKRQLTFLSDLSSIVLERFAMEEVTGKLMLMEDRNRIANEIHDSVSQQLFSISSALYRLKTNWRSLPEKDIIKQLELLSSSGNIAMRELRQSIYSLSTQKFGERIFFSSIQAYLESLARLNDIVINVDLIGEQEQLPAGLEKCIYRIVCEATGNALKHGNSSIISVQLHVNSGVIKIIVEDNGSGFELEKMDKESVGLGLRNMQKLVHSVGGIFKMKSTLGVGTKVHVELPTEQINVIKQGGIA